MITSLKYIGVIMGYRAPMQEETMRKGPWLEEEDERLATFVKLMGERRWDSIARESGLRRSGKSCRLRWMNYLRPDLKHGQISAEEELIILQLHELWGNKWSKIARRLPGRTDNEIKNYWRTHLRKKAQAQEQEKVQSILNTQTKDDIPRASDHSLDVEWSDYAFLTSPYEARLFDWILGSSNDQETLKHEEECDVMDSCFYNSTWILGECDSVWDYCSVSPCDVEQTNRGDSFYYL